MSVKSILLELRAALPTQNIESVGEIYQRLEIASTGYPVTIANKPHQMQMMRKYLMQTCTAEMLRINTSINAKQLTDYDIIADIDRMIEAVDAANI